MEDGKQYKVSAKNAAGKWWGYGNLKKNKFDKWQIGMKVTEELKQMILANEGKWINFSLFEDEGRKPGEQPSYDTAPHSQSDHDLPF